jgi:ankyrin repeat protein
MGWTPLMMAASVKDGEALVDLLLSKGADVNKTSELSNFVGVMSEGANGLPKTTMVRYGRSSSIWNFMQHPNRRRLHYISLHQRIISILLENLSRTRLLRVKRISVSSCRCIVLPLLALCL